MSAVATFSEHRPLLFGIAYRMLGSVQDAEDVVQDAYLRWEKADQRAVESPKAWLSTVVTRLSIDQLRSARKEREVYVGEWLPEPLVTDDALPGAAAELADSLSTSKAGRITNIYVVRNPDKLRSLPKPSEAN